MITKSICHTRILQYLLIIQHQKRIVEFCHKHLTLVLEQYVTTWQNHMLTFQYLCLKPRHSCVEMSPLVTETKEETTRGSLNSLVLTKI
jgi:hypothetical protein